MSKIISMIERTFTEKKYRRTYIGGSKQKEKRIFTNVQGRAEDNSQCDWFEYRRILTQYFDDVWNVLDSWKTLTENISSAIMIIAILFLHTDVVFYPILGLSILVRIVSFILTLKIEKHLNNYNMCLSTTLGEIKKLTGFEFSK
jgi:hypothetical protein